MNANLRPNLTIKRIFSYNIPLILPAFLISYQKSQLSLDDFKERFSEFDQLTDRKNITPSLYSLKIRDISDTVNDTSDSVLNFFSGMVGLMAAVPETVRSAWSNGEGYLKTDFTTQVASTRNILNVDDGTKEIVIFEQFVDFYVTGLKMQNGFTKNESTKNESLFDLKIILNELDECASGLEQERPSLKKFIDFLNKYSHRPIGKEYELTFFINFMHQLFIEYLYERRPALTYSSYADFCNKFAKIIRHAVIEIEQFDIIGIYNASFDLWDLVEGDL